MRGRLGNVGFDALRRMSVAEQDRVAAQPLTLRVFAKNAHRRGECARQIDVVAVEERGHVAGDPLDAFVDGVNLSAIWLADPVGEMPFVTVDDVDAVIAASTVDDD